MGTQKLIAIFLLNLSFIVGSPLVLERSSPSGRSVVAISSSNPEYGRSFSASASAEARSDSGQDQPNGEVVQSFSFASPGKSVVGTGRSFSSASNYNPYLSPFFIWPLNFDDFNPYEAEPKDDYIKSFESFFDSPYKGDGNIRTVTAVNDNGHIYGKVGTVSFDNRIKPNAESQKKEANRN